MSNKDIIKIATNEDILYFLEQIKHANDNMCYKTEYEQKISKKEIQEIAKRVKDLL